MNQSESREEAMNRNFNFVLVRSELEWGSVQLNHTKGAINRNIVGVPTQNHTKGTTASTPNTHSEDRTAHIPAIGLLSPNTENIPGNWRVSEEHSFRLNNQDLEASKLGKEIEVKRKELKKLEKEQNLLESSCLEGEARKQTIERFKLVHFACNENKRTFR